VRRFIPGYSLGAVVFTTAPVLLKKRSRFTLDFLNQILAIGFLTAQVL
jgi:hypothetical protein